MSIMLNIDSKKLHGLLAAYNAEHGTTLAALSRRMGRTGSYLNTMMHRGTASPNATAMLRALYDIRPEDYVKTVEEPEEPKEPAWDLRYEIEPAKAYVKVQILVDGECLTSGYARIKQPQTNLTVTQAISYATHICYKKAEQMELEAL